MESNHHETLLCFSDYRLLLKEREEGSGGVVWKAVRKDGLTCAVKIFRDPLDKIIDERGVPKEAAIMEILNEPGHLHVVKYYGWGKVNITSDLENTNMKQFHCFSGEVGAFMVMEWIEGVTLKDKITETYFGKQKRIQVFKQLLEALIYVHSKQIIHGEVYLDNIIISMPNKLVCQYRLVLCDFGASSFLPAETNTIAVDSKLGQDHFQCGGILFSLFSSANIKMQLTTNKFMQKEALLLAKKLIDARKRIDLDTVIRDPFLNNASEDSTFSQYYDSTSWNAEIVDHISGHLIQTGGVADFVNASLACKLFYLSLRRQFLCVPQFQNLDTSVEYDLSSLSPQDFQASVIDMSLKIYHIAYSPHSRFWRETLASENFQKYELELVHNFTALMNQEISKIENLLARMTMDNFKRLWQLVFFRFHDIRVACNRIRNGPLGCLAWYGRNRAKGFISNHKNFILKDLEDETKLYYRIIYLMKALLKKVNAT